MLFPAKYCGLWTLLSSTNYDCRPGSQLRIDYTRIQFSLRGRWGPLTVTKNIYGGIILKSDSCVKVSWVEAADLEVDSVFFPTIQFPAKNRCPPMTVSHCLDEPNRLITLRDSRHEYVFRVSTAPPEKKTNLLKVFLLQLVFDWAIRGLH
jgi:hypothetical protein